ncbi:MAG TPA: hypothetical protein VFM33_05335 [Aquabacterium sp.]|nr:hypothetical protein [Aquabacterium sp.]
MSPTFDRLKFVRSALIALTSGLMLGLTSLAQAQEEAAVSNEVNYRLGDGFHIPDSNWRLGGYATASHERLQDRVPRTSLDNVSLFVWWEGEGRWKLFSELDYENPISSRDEHTDDTHRYLALERLYADYAVSDTSTLRIGKFLTPIGRWNLMHATPLVWSTSRPLVTRHVFPTNATGLMFSSTIPMGPDGLEYAIYGSDGSDWRRNPEVDAFKQALGTHVSLPTWFGHKLGLSYATFEQERSPGERKQLLGFDYLWASRGYELSAEGVYRRSAQGHRWDERGAFIQGVVPLHEQWFGFARVEAFRQAAIEGTTQLWVLGVNYRYTPAVVFKAEWLTSRNNDIGVPTGFLSSVSILF